MDAAAMMLTVREAGDLGVLNLSMIHDSYGTLAAQTDELVMALRGAFVKMYVDHDVLAELLESVLTRLPQKYHKDIPPLPPKGKLDITKVLESDYFFA
jgi:DNA-directed RNA polymerase